MYERGAKLEYKFLEYASHESAESGLNQYIAEGWQFVAYQTAGEGTVSHFVVVSRAARPEARKMGFGS